MAADRAPIVLSWADMAAIVDELAVRVRADGIPDVLVGVLRGGVIPAVLLAHRLSLRAVRAVEVVHTTADGVDAAKTVHPRVGNEASLGHLAGLDVLVVDDIAGSGDTIANTVELVQVTGAARIRTAVCVVNVANWQRVQPAEQALTYIVNTVEGWVIFPWENQWQRQ